MKVLFISNHAELSGWSSQACGHILALDKVGVEVVPRRLSITGKLNTEVHPRILDLEKQSSERPDIIILNTLPSFYERTGRTRMAGYYMCETSNFRAAGWAPKINMLDRAFVPCWHNKEASLASNITIPIDVVPLAIDVEKFSRQYVTHAARTHNENKFLFYTIGEFTSRKNLDAIIRAFHLEFAPNEPVELIIKTTPVGLGNNPQQTLSGRIENIKTSLKLYKNLHTYKRESILCEFSPEETLNSLHFSCDAYVSASRGEAFNIPLTDALGFGNTVVSPNHSGMDYLTEKNSFVVTSRAEPCYNMLDTLADLYTGSENVFEPSITSLREQMRAAYSKRDLARRKAEQGRKDILKFSYENIGKIYRTALEKIL